MKKLSYLKQIGFAKNLDEAIKVIESFEQTTIKKKLIVNDICLDKLELVFNGELNGTQIIHTTNTGLKGIIIEDYRTTSNLGE